MEKDIKVSIIVPVYNCKKYLNKCLDNLVEQTLCDIEIIIVDDGSTDGSSDICKEYSCKYEKCKYYYQENGGVSKARNRGIQEAKGTYLIFSDADDYYEKNAVEILYDRANSLNADVVSGGIVKHFVNHDEMQECDDFCVQGDEINPIIVRMTENFALNQVWGKIYLSKLVTENAIFFDESINCGEDLDWICRFLCKVNRMAGIHDIVYVYNIFNNITLSDKFDTGYFERINKSYKSMVELYQARKMYKKFGKILHKRQDNNIWNGFQKINDKRYKLSFAEKVNYVKIGLESLSYYEYKNRNDKYLSRLQKLILNTHNPYFIVIIFKVISYIH